MKMTDTRCIVCKFDWGEDWDQAYDEGRVAIFRYGGIDLLCEPQCRQKFEDELQAYEDEGRSAFEEWLDAWA